MENMFFYRKVSFKQVLGFILEQKIDDFVDLPFINN